MKRLKRIKQVSNFAFGFLLALSIFAVAWAFNFADAERGYDAVGGEIFVVALPFAVVALKMWLVEQLNNLRNEVK